MADPTAPETTSQRQGRSAIRTMRSDVSEFLQTSKPSLVSLLAREVERQEDKLSLILPHPWRGKVLASLAVTMIAATAALYLLWAPAEETLPQTSELLPPQSLIFFDDVRDITINRSGRELADALKLAGQSRGTPGSIRRLVIRMRSAAGPAAFMSLRQFFSLANTNPPTELLDGLSAPPQFFLYQQEPSPVFGFIVEVRNAPRLLQALHSAEPSLQLKLEPLYLGSPLRASLEAFHDQTYRNIDYRYLTLDSVTQRGLGYLHFPARRLMVITTSTEAIRAVIDRLLGGR